MKVLRSSEMAVVDRKAREDFGIPSLVLMENAGLKSWEYLKSRVWSEGLPEGALVFTAGKGNNGGDALVMARQAFLDGKREISIITARDELSGDPGIHLAVCRSLGIRILSWESSREKAEDVLQTAAWIIDGVAGIGIRGALREPLSAMVQAISASEARVVAVDVPSGVRDGFRAGDPVVRADITLTMGLPKLCLYLPEARPLCGDIAVIRLGFPPALVENSSLPFELLTERELSRLLPCIPPDVYKNKRGTIAVFAGSPGTTGAAVLCSEAALRSRGGLVTVYAEGSSFIPVASRSTSVMVRPWDGDTSPGDFDFSRYSGLLVGPGWGTGENRLPWLRTFFSSGLHGVLDADGVKLLGSLLEKEVPDLGGRWVLTPHPGEFLRIADAEKGEIMADPASFILASASRLNAVIVLKGHVTLIASPDGRLRILDGMNPALATGGTGDVLAGIIAGILAGGADVFDAASAGVLLHDRIARKAFRERGWFIAEDLLPYVSREFPGGAV